MQPAIRLNDETYEKLLKLKGELIKTTGKDKTFNDAVEWLLQKVQKHD